MKKLLLASAVAALSVTAAQAAPTVYGKAFLSVDAVEDARVQLNSNASRIGVKGKEALTANTDVVYQLEYRLEIDANNNNGVNRNFESRDTYLGLSNKQYGTLVAGRLTAIDGQVDYANVLAGSPVGGDVVLAAVDAPRANNAFAYFSPSYNGVQVLGMYVLDEDKTDTSVALAGSDSAAINRTANDSLGRDAFGVAVKYEPQAAYRVGASYLQSGETKAARISGAYDVTPSLTVGALYQNTDLDTENNENAFTLSASQKVANTAWTTYGQLDLVDNVGGEKDEELKRIVVGGKYAFNKATTGHIYGSYARAEDATTKGDVHGIGAGLEYKF